jgi:hypothetical protein
LLPTAGALWGSGFCLKGWSGGLSAGLWWRPRVSPTPDGQHETIIVAIDDWVREAHGLRMHRNLALICPEGEYVPDGIAVAKGAFAGRDWRSKPDGVVMVLEVTERRAGERAEWSAVVAQRHSRPAAERARRGSATINSAGDSRRHAAGGPQAMSLPSPTMCVRDRCRPRPRASMAARLSISRNLPGNGQRGTSSPRGSPGRPHRRRAAWRDQHLWPDPHQSPRRAARPVPTARLARYPCRGPRPSHRPAGLSTTRRSGSRTASPHGRLLFDDDPLTHVSPTGRTRSRSSPSTTRRWSGRRPLTGCS